MRRSIFTFLLINLYLTAVGKGDLQKIKAAFFDPESKYILVAAHRSAHNQAPENSLKAMHIDPGFYTVEVVDYIKAHLGRLWINALGDTDSAYKNGYRTSLDALLAGGANVIQTDIPELMLDYLRQHDLHW